MLRLVARVPVPLAVRPQQLLRCSVLAHRRCASIAEARVAPASTQPELRVGDRVHGYEVLDTAAHPDFALQSVTLRHVKTNAMHLHVRAPGDSTNCFAVAFRTPPVNSRGVPHILEHTVLCGSQQYPVRDPFFRMMERSLSSWMNAMTASDFTIYPFIASLPADFDNLMRVYCDAVFRPLLRDVDFWQEGFRLELASPSDLSASLLEPKGVVFNEMKGYLADGNTFFWSSMQERLHPGTPYQYNSGGDPKHIRDLEHDELVAAHRRCYNPSNALFYTYGDLPLASHLARLDSVLCQPSVLASCTNSVPDIPFTPPLREPLRLRESCAFDPMSDPTRQSRVGVAWALHGVRSPYEAFKFSCLSYLLTHGPNSPLYQALVEARLCTGLAPGTGYDASTRTPGFLVGAQGVEHADGAHEAVVDAVWAALRRAADEGFSDARVQAVMHQLEVGVRNKTARFGLELCFATMQEWIHGRAPLTRLSVIEFMRRLEGELRDQPNLFRDMIREHLLGNGHHVTLSMQPDEQFAADLANDEQRFLAAKGVALDINARRELVERAERLSRAQAVPTDSSCLPCVSSSDIRRAHLLSDGAVESRGNGHRVIVHPWPSNGMVNVKLAADVTSVPAHLRNLVPLYVSLLGQLGTKSMSYADVSTALELSTASFGADSVVVPAAFGRDVVTVAFSCLERVAPRAGALVRDILLDTAFDSVDRLRDIVSEMATNLAAGIVDRGHVYVRDAVEGRLSLVASRGNAWSGLPQVLHVQSLVAQLDADPAPLVARLRELHEFVVRQYTRSCLVSDEASANRVQGVVGDTLLDALPIGSGTSTTSWPIAGSGVRANGATAAGGAAPLADAGVLGVLIAADLPIQYAARSVWVGTPHMHRDSQLLRLAGLVANNRYLHKHVRERGGAYGSGATYHYGCFTMHSYRDPTPAQSVQAFEEARLWLCAAPPSTEDVESAKLQMFQRLDAPLSPSDVGHDQLVHGLSQDDLSWKREVLLEATPADVHDVCVRLLGGDTRRILAGVLGPKASGQHDGWSVVDA